MDYCHFAPRHRCIDTINYRLTTECTSSILEERRLFIEFTNFERCSKCLVISVAITMSMIAWRIVRNSSLVEDKS